MRLYTRPAVAPYVERFLQDGQRSRLIAGGAGDPRGDRVPAAGHPRAGLGDPGRQRRRRRAHPARRGLIVEVGTEPETGAGLFRTSELFLERMGMQSLDELPSLAPLLPELSGLEADEL